MFQSTSQVKKTITTTHYYYYCCCTMAIPYHETSTHPTTPPTPSKWGPYSGAGDFTANMIVILIILFCALVLALALNYIVRYLFCHHRQPRESPADADPEKPPLRNESAPPTDPAQTRIFSSAGTKLAGTEAECAICLAEFADGDRVHVVPACNHGFHVGCIERWLRTKSSCPTCRSGCQVVVVGPMAPA